MPCQFLQPKTALGLDGIEYSRFRDLLKEVEQTFAAEQGGGGVPPIEQWKGELITSFQESLRTKAGGTVSEKWFYTHVKNTHDKLPRVDTLNLLCAYSGHKDWARYAVANLETVSSRFKKLRVIILIGTIPLVASILMFTNWPSSSVSHQICLVDGDLGHGVDGEKVKVEILREDQSSEFIDCDAQGCFELHEEGELSFVVHAPYYKKDTVHREVRDEASEVLRLRSDDYALMIRVISTNDVKDWKRRRDQLDQMIAEDASIVFVAPGDNRMLEIFTKREFISKLTTPTRALNDLEIISTEYRDDLIVHLRYTINPENLETP